MKKLLYIILLLFPIICNAQTNKDTSNRIIGAITGKYIIDTNYDANSSYWKRVVQITYPECVILVGEDGFVRIRYYKWIKKTCDRQITLHKRSMFHYESVDQECNVKITFSKCMHKQDDRNCIPLYYIDKDGGSHFFSLRHTGDKCKCWTL